MTRRIAVLGATGSIGASTLDVIARHQPQYRATVLTANQHVAALADLCAIHRPELAVIADATRKDELAAALAARHVRCAVDAGSAALTRAAAGDLADTVVAAVVGAAGLASTLAAARSGKRLLLANKEAIVMAGDLLLAAVRAGGAELLPIDSEHNALFQCLPGGRPDLAAAGVRRLTLTASGGPFRGRHRDELRAVTPEAACKHPKWSMGRKISVDSATLMNKGLEVIEAHHLFGAPAAMIDVLVHPESIVHALVEYRDGTQLAQLCQPDMRTAIAHALAWPQRIEAGVTALDLARVGSLHFERPDTDTFRCLPLARAALAAGGDATTILNAANEAAVAAFLDRRLPFLAIADVVEATLAALPAEPVRDIGGLIQRDLTARARATRIIAGFAPSGSPLPIGPA